MHEEIKQYCELYKSWNSPTYLGPVKTSLTVYGTRLCCMNFTEARNTNHWLSAKTCLHNSVLGFFKNIKGQECKEYLGESFSWALMFCKNARVRAEHAFCVYTTPGVILYGK